MSDSEDSTSGSYDSTSESDKCSEREPLTSTPQISDADWWEERRGVWRRNHCNPRSTLFHSQEALGGPPEEEIESKRETEIFSPCGQIVLVHQDVWDGSSCQNSESYGTWKDWEWTGTTTFYKKVPFLAEPDRWEETPAMWIRVHSTPRLHSFHPYGAEEGPLIGELTGDRVTEFKFLNGSSLVVMDKCHQADERMSMTNLWIGTTTFLK